MRDSDLHAYVDGQLDPARRIEVETWLAEDEEAARRVDAYRAQNAALHALFDPVLKEPITGELADLAEELGARIAAAESRRGRWVAANQNWMRVAASVALVAVGLGAGWLGRGQVTPPPPQAPERPGLVSFAEEAAQAHTFYAGSRFEVEMGGDDQDALNNWLSERLGQKVFGPDLTSAGYRLIGGRSLPTESGTVAQYMYQTDDGNRLTLFVGKVPSGKQEAFSFVQRGEAASFYWTEGALSYALVGRYDRDRLMGIAQTVHQKLKSGPAPHEAKPQGQTGQQQDTRPPPAPQPPEQQLKPTPASDDQGRPKPS